MVQADSYDEALLKGLEELGPIPTVNFVSVRCELEGRKRDREKVARFFLEKVLLNGSPAPVPM